jgi:chemotaxis protein methyltransferase CheR
MRAEPAVPGGGGEDPGHAAEVAALLEDIRERYGYDLLGYNATSMARRVAAALARLGIASVAALRSQVVADPELFATVLEHLTVRVSEMFRDPDFYKVFRARVVPILRTYPLLRIWHAGCANGDEAYASAVLLDEEGLYDRCQIYATDLNPRALERARLGTFPAARLEGFSQNYVDAGGRGSLLDHCTVGYGQVTMRESLRRHLHFFHHDLVSDHVFGEMHVVFCRNVLIYFGADLRQRVLAKLCASLCHGGFLCLGSSEQLWRSTARPPLATFDAAARIYRHDGATLAAGAAP